MPIHDQGYRRYDGTRMPRGRAWAVITTAGLRTFFAKRAFLALLLLSWLPFIVRTVQIYAAANFPQMAFIAPTAETFRQFLNQQDLFVFFITVYVGAGLIANDRRANALQIYLSKPLTRGEYVMGKMAILITFLLMVTWLPAVLLLLVQVSFAGSFAFLKSNLYLFPAITLLSFVEATMVSAAMLALSSLSNNSRFVGILYAGVIFFSDALFGVLRAVTGESGLSWVSFGNNLAQLGDAIFRVPLRYSTPWPVSLLMVIALVVTSALILERRVRGVEVIA
jgi:ABC-type transport system involved in multi-copper enzyme maturation permease subunit